MTVWLSFQRAQLGTQSLRKILWDHQGVSPDIPYMVLFKGVMMFSIHHPQNSVKCQQQKAFRKSLPNQIVEFIALEMMTNQIHSYTSYNDDPPILCFNFRDTWTSYKLNKLQPSEAVHAVQKRAL